jgi:hypothetical protein
MPIASLLPGAMGYSQDIQKWRVALGRSLQWQRHCKKDAAFTRDTVSQC